jgi:hypothetical protein
VGGLQHDEFAIDATSAAGFRMLGIVRQCKKQLQHRRNSRCNGSAGLIEEYFRARRRCLIDYLQKLRQSNREIFRCRHGKPPRTAFSATRA